MFSINDFKPGQRVELHPGTDRWMMGDRYGVVLKALRTGYLRVQMDRSGKAVRVHPENISEIIP